MGVNTNMIVSPYGNSAKEQMAIFDQLPLELRTVLNNGLMSWCPYIVDTSWRQSGMPVAQIADLLKREEKSTVAKDAPTTWSEDYPVELIGG